MNYGPKSNNGPGGVSYEEAALMMGCDHHYVRMLTSRGTFRIVDRIEVRRNVFKVYIRRDDVEQYIEDHRYRVTKKVRLTPEEWDQFVRQFGHKAVKD